MVVVAGRGSPLVRERETAAGWAGDGHPAAVGQAAANSGARRSRHRLRVVIPSWKVRATVPMAGPDHVCRNDIERARREAGEADAAARLSTVGPSMVTASAAFAPA